MDSHMASNGSCFMVTWTIFKTHLLEVGLTQNQKTMALRTLTLVEFIGSVYRTETMHQLLRIKSKFPNHFVFTLGRDLFLYFWSTLFNMVSLSLYKMH